MNDFPGTTERRTSTLRRNEERFRLLVDSVRDYAIFMLDPEGHVLTWNAGAERFKGYRAEEIIGSHFSRFYPADALASGLPEHELAEARRVGAFEQEGWRVRKDGSEFWANVVITAMRDETGHLVGYAKVTRDLTQRRIHEEALRQSEERFRLLVEGVAEYAIFMLDVNGRVASWNVGATRMKGYSSEDILGRHFSIFYPQEAKDSGWPAHELEMAMAHGSFVDNGWRVRKDGTTLWANVTITALRDAKGELIGFAKLTRDMSESRRVQAIEQASRQRDEILEAERSARMAAQRATRLKDEFLATLSHELRTPLSSILGWTQLLLRSPDSDAAQQRRAIEIIERNARVQVQLIDDLLDLSKIITGKVRLDLQETAMHDVVRAALESAMPAAEAKEVRLSFDLVSAGTGVTGDAARLQQVVWNLLTNAIKFTPKGGHIDVQLRVAGGRVTLGVHDTGIGIPAAFLPQVFDRFSQQDGSTTRAYGGLGLGLAISKQLVELHGGAIRAESPGEGRGATFTVDLPASARAPERPARSPAAAEPEPTAAQALPSLAGVHIFAVDDEPDARELLCRVFEAQGAIVTGFGSAEAVLGALKAHRPTVLVSDIGMPDMDGYQLLRAIRATERGGPRIPALALTAFARAEDRKHALVAGYQAHLAKPFDVAELVLLVADLVDRLDQGRPG